MDHVILPEAAARVVMKTGWRQGMWQIRSEVMKSRGGAGMEETEGCAGEGRWRGGGIAGIALGRRVGWEDAQGQGIYKYLNRPCSRVVP